ncbi:MAG TPA: cytochrome c [Parafilimonas sp.]|jgi:mono/diheme cytochrome c family protein
MKQIAFVAFCITIVAIISAQQPVQTSKQRGNALYKKYCLTCHQADGSGVPKMNPPLIKTSYITGDKTKLIKWVLQGSVQHIQIDGEDYSNNMPAQNYLTDQQIADVLTYARSSFGNKATAVLPSEVKDVRTSLK